MCRKIETLVEPMTGEEIRAVIATVDPNPVLGEYEKQVAHALIDHVGKKGEE